MTHLPIAEFCYKVACCLPCPWVEAIMQQGRLCALLPEARNKGELGLVLSVCLGLLELTRLEILFESRRRLSLRVQWILPQPFYNINVNPERWTRYK